MNTQYVFSVYESLMTSFGIFFRALIVLYTVYVGYVFYKSESRFSVCDMILSYLITASVYSVVFEWSWFYSVIIKTTLNMTLDTASFFISAATSNDAMGNFGSIHDVFKSLDQTLIDFYTAVQNLSPKGNILTYAWRYVCFIIAMIPLFMVFLAMYAAFFVIFCIAFFSMFIFYMIGGVCLLFVGFKETRHICFTWIRGLLNYMLLAVFAAVVMGICGKGIHDAVSLFAAQAETASVIVSDAYIKVFVWCTFCLAMILKTPDFAAHLTGTMAGSTSGVAGALSAGTSALGGGMLAGSKLAGGWAARKTWGLTRKGAGFAGNIGMNALEKLKIQRHAK